MFTSYAYIKMNNGDKFTLKINDKNEFLETLTKETFIITEDETYIKSSLISSIKFKQEFI